MTGSGVKPPGVWKTLLGVVSHVKTASNVQNSCKWLSVAFSHCERKD